MSNRGTMALVNSRRQTPSIRRTMVHVGAVGVEDVRRRMDAVRTYLYDNLLRLKPGEIGEFDHLTLRLQAYETDPNPSAAELAGLEEKLRSWEARVRELQGLPPEGAQPDTQWNPTPIAQGSIESGSVGSLVAIGLGVVLGGGLLYFVSRPRRAA